MTTENRFIQLDLDELYYIADKTKIRSLDYFKEIYSDPAYEYTEDEIEQCAKDDYCQEIYENSMSGDEVIEQLNTYHRNIEILKTQCKDFMEMLDDMSVAYVYDERIEAILNENQTEST